jgi:hypothetical protein
LFSEFLLLVNSMPDFDSPMDWSFSATAKTFPVGGTREQFKRQQCRNQNT